MTPARHWLYPLLTAATYIVAMPALRYAYERYLVDRWADKRAKDQILAEQRKKDFEKTRTSLEALSVHLRNDLIEVRSCLLTLTDNLEKVTQENRVGLTRPQQANLIDAKKTVEKFDAHLAELEKLGLSTNKLMTLATAVNGLLPEWKRFIPSWKKG